MEYRQGSIGRVFVVRFDEGDDFLNQFLDLIKKEDVRSGWFQILGGLRKAGVVTGPKEPVMPPEPVWENIDDARETIGAGSVYWDEKQPRIHLHAAMGHHGETLTACIRKGTQVYLILELLLFEITGIEAGRPY